MLHRDRRPQVVEMDDAFFLGQLVGLALLRRQLRIGVAVDARRHVRRRFLFRSPENAVARQLRQQLHRRVGRNAARLHELKDIHEVVDPVFDGRAGHGPAAVAMEAVRRLGRLRVAALDALRFIQNHHVEMDRFICGFRGVAG